MEVRRWSASPLGGVLCGACICCNHRRLPIPQENHIYNSPSIDTYDYSIYRPHAEPHHEEKKLTIF
jgi:hypothetical protein